MIHQVEVDIEAEVVGANIEVTMAEAVTAEAHSEVREGAVQIGEQHQ